MFLIKRLTNVAALFGSGAVDSNSYLLLSDGVSFLLLSNGTDQIILEA